MLTLLYQFHIISAAFNNSDGPNLRLKHEENMTTNEISLTARENHWMEGPCWVKWGASGAMVQVDRSGWRWRVWCVIWSEASKLRSKEQREREGEWSLGDKSRRRYNVGALITDPQAMEHALQRISYTRYIQITMCTYLITCILLLLGFLQSLNHDRQELQYVIHIYVIDETMC